VPRPPPPGPSTPQSRPPTWIFVVEIIYLAILVALLIIYGRWSSLRDWVPDPVGTIPLGVLWWGAVGAVTVSLTGIFDHRRDWDPYYRNWHLARPAIGAVMGGVAYLIFTTLIRSTDAAVQEKGKPVYYVIAFVVGYREETFRRLIKRVTDVLLEPGADQANPPNPNP
jgi:hypothetical protein